ncbi:MAG: substrate-binding domain-containing protein [Verrucomicrobiota bacterium]
MALRAADFVGTDLLLGSLTQGINLAAGKTAADFGGTLPGRQAFIAGRASAAVLMMRDREVAPVPSGKIGVVEFRLASAVVVVATHGSNRAEQITVENLANVFARDPRSPARNWNDIDPAARSELITPAVSSPAGSMVLEIFQGLALEGQSFRPDVRLRIEPELADDLLASRAGTITLTPRRPSGRGKVLQVADGRPGRSSTAYSPDENNVHNGDYPLQVPLIVYVRQDRLAELTPALRWLFSDEAAALLEKQGLVPAPKAARTRFVQRLDTR